MNRKVNHPRAIILLWVLYCLPVVSFSQGKKASSYSAYLFTYFTGNRQAEEAIRFAISMDGYHYRALNRNQPVIPSAKISSTGGVRDPHILRGADGKTFYMVVTDMVSTLGWDSNRAMVLLQSTDLIHWTSAVVNIQQRFPGHDSLKRVWAPQTIYDHEAGKYMVYFSMKHGKDPDKIYYAYTNKEFTDLESEPKQLFFHPQGTSCIDGDIVFADGKYHLFFKTEGSGNGIKKAVAEKLTGNYVMEDKYLQQTTEAVEGAGTFKLNNRNEWILMYDVYMKGKYQFTRSKDLQHFSVIDQDVTMNFHPRHGTVMAITQTEATRLLREWMPAEDIVADVLSAQVKKINIAFDSSVRSWVLPLKPGTVINRFRPAFVKYPGVKIQPERVNFADGPVAYKVSMTGKKPETVTLSARIFNNPVLEGYFADPDIIFSEKEKRYYMYPTSDGFNGWSGTYFKAFSSADLVSWKDEGVILDLQKDVTWAKKNAWAPCVIERKVNGGYKYFYYFCAAQKIGVAVSDHPGGPFVDSGKPLIDQRPEGVKGGQQIDPDVFLDPQSGKYYIYWGNGYMAGAELNEDMISIKAGTVKVLTPDKTFREGAHVFFRKGIYYFLWSEDDTRSENYRVRYGTARGPLDSIAIPGQNMVIKKDPSNGIYGTGHNSTIQLPGTDQWCIIYHRFNYPNGINMGPAAGYNREVCIDRLFFDADGSIMESTPTHQGISQGTEQIRK